MTQQRARVHLVAGGFPPGMPAGHDHDYARQRLLEWLGERDIGATTGNDFRDIDRWLPGAELMISYVAGPFLDEAMNEYVNEWLAAGGHWLAFHGTSGGRAVRVEGERRRAMLKQPHHATLGAFFLNHPPLRKFNVDVQDSHPIAKGVPTSFEVMDEPYMVEVQDPERVHVLLTAELGPDNSPEGFGFVYESDTALLEDGKTRVMGYTKEVGKGGVTYFALGHCHTPRTNSQPFVDESVAKDGGTPLTFRGPWTTPGFERLVKNTLDFALDT